MPVDRTHQVTDSFLGEYISPKWRSNNATAIALLSLNRISLSLLELAVNVVQKWSTFYPVRRSFVEVWKWASSSRVSDVYRNKRGNMSCCVREEGVSALVPPKSTADGGDCCGLFDELVATDDWSSLGSLNISTALVEAQRPYLVQPVAWNVPFFAPSMDDTSAPSLFVAPPYWTLFFGKLSNADPGEVADGEEKVTTEYRVDEEGRRIKVLRHYRIERRQVSKYVARRKLWKKVGDAKNDPPGPNAATTKVGEEIQMQFVSAQEEETSPEEDMLAKLRSQKTKMVKCRICKEDHWTMQCPFKDNVALPEHLKEEAKPVVAVEVEEKVKSGKYIPPSMREGANRRGESMAQSRTRNEAATIRVTNLSEHVRDSDLQELFRCHRTSAKKRARRQILATTGGRNAAR
ncbi:hypothetical protein HPB51_013935 [Rhipicephalus microplus]|uniref:Eukaryotic translation initiation factor 3 subunit G N-terminal domain-containing protein n=1 Tax=Rhipicephalus microplus TaxID=6941 RepID=A0A9J6DGE8_RHIMP|nr:hypothetical protein HPB51_013935 [Rhipicephalus microplus]